MKKIITTTIAASVLVLSSCTKFEEGGYVSKADEKIIGSWTLSQYLRNGNDETSTLYIKNLKEVYSEGGGLTRTFNEKDGDVNTDDGTYKFSDDQKEVKVDGVSSISDFSSNTNSVSSSSLTIVKLDKDEFWYRYTNSSDVHEFHFSK
jgi:hypothetical protein